MDPYVTLLLEPSDQALQALCRQLLTQCRSLGVGVRKVRGRVILLAFAPMIDVSNSQVADEADLRLNLGPGFAASKLADVEDFDIVFKPLCASAKTPLA